jgi:uncharacterized protein (UPF0303 family)
VHGRPGRFEQQTQLDLDRYAAHGDAFPGHRPRGGVLGIVALSGLPRAGGAQVVVGVLGAFLGIAICSESAERVLFMIVMYLGHF